MKAIPLFFTLVALTTSIQLVPKLSDSTIIWGQVGKQSVAAEMARSLATNQREGIFPLRHFMEIYHDRPVPWAEEVPVYSIINQSIARLTSLDIVVVGRLVSFVSFLFLLLGFFTLGTELQKHLPMNPTQKSKFKNLSLNWILVFLALCFPVFRIYSVSIMPDLPMASALIWTWVFALRGRWKSAGALGALACAFKYYAAFSIAGIVLWRYREKFKAAFWGACVVAPTLAYLIGFLIKGIPNPITEYPIWNGGGHVGLQMLINPSWYSRLVTWLLVKNPGLPAGLLSCVGFFLLWKMRRQFSAPLLHFIGTQFAAGVFFVTMFSTSFYVHDYYGLQWGLLQTLAAGIALYFMMERAATKKLRAAVCALAVLVAGFGFERTHSATSPQNYFLGLSDFLKSNTTPEGFGLIFAERPVESALFSSSRSAWVVHLNRWSAPAKNAEAAAIQVKTNALIQQRLSDPRLEWVALFTVDEKREDLLERIRKHLQNSDFQAGKPLQSIEKDYLPLHSRDSAAHLVWIPRIR